MAQRHTCIVCGKGGVAVFFEMPQVPALVNFLHPTRESAVGCPKGDIVLGFCPSCGFIGNLAFDASRLVYEEGYENPLHFSEVFRAYTRRLAEDLVEKYDLHGKKLVEIGCGDADFLRLLCEIGPNRGVGFDPSYPASLPTRYERVEIIRDSYSKDHADLEPDFVCLRHTLEHIHDPTTLLRQLQNSVGKRTGVTFYIEVPNASYTLGNRFVWDIIYEHPSYFTPFSLSNVIESSGLRVTRVYEAFSGQYLCAEARSVAAAAGEAPRPTHPAAPAGGASPAHPADNAGEEARQIEAFAASYRETIERWKDRLAELRSMGRKAVVWGAGSKGITFLNVLDGRNIVDCVVDLNPNKRGKFVPGSGHEIVAPEQLRTARPDVVIVANPAYRAEIEKALGKMALHPEVISL